MSLRRIASKALIGEGCCNVRQIYTSSVATATTRREFYTSISKYRRERKHASSGLIYTANKAEEAVILLNTLQEYTQKEQRYFGYVMWVNLGLGLGTWAFIKNRKSTYST